LPHALRALVDTLSLQAHIPLDKKSKKAKGLAFVKFEEPANALAAFRAADGATFQGRLLHVMPAVDARPVPADAKAKTLKEQKKETLKADATKDFNWSMLYMSADAVASSVAERLGVDKSQILDANDDSGVSPAVKLALAETRVIQETKAFLSKEGLDLDVVQSGKRVARSDTTILVKNIPHGTTTEALRELFAKHGDVERVVMPPAGTLAIVEMPVAGEARVAFRSLAYKRIGNGVLYLEKAPVGLLKPKEEVELAAPSASTGAAAPPSKTEQMHGASAADNDDAEPGATLFVKNLSFATTDETLANFFAALPELAFARVQTRSDASKPGVRLSMGYGFAGFRSAAAAKAARQALDGHDLDGHSVSLAFAKRGQDEDKSKGKGAAAQTSSTKIVVKNLPFEANKKEVRALFAAYNVKSVRVPRKPAGGATAGARGFAFVEVATRRDAEAAMEALAHTHLLGRHLVLRYDKEDAQGVEGVRARTQRALPTGEETVARKAKLHLGEDDIRDAVARERAAADAADDDDDE
jgi:multiple RNA-binding domain-containing protein 1